VSTAIAGQYAELKPARTWLELGARVLAQAGIESATLDASLLLAEACGAERARLLAGLAEVKPGQALRFKSLLARRVAREPVAYILGRKEFFSMELLVSRRVLIPRPETETLVEAALSWARSRPLERILDLGTGCGAIALALARHLPEAQIVATDICAAALALARRNALRLGCAERIEFRRGDLWSALEGAGEKPQSFDLVLANPPYIAQGDFDRLPPEVKSYEPEIALLGGADGLAYYRKIARGLPGHLVSGGRVAFEVGLEQAGHVAQICRQAGARDTYRVRDLAGVERMVAACF
jgi:release factor glutamine methyltransferase